MDAQLHLESVLWRACDDLLIRSTNPWELDEALTDFGFETGPCEVMDHVGLVHVLERLGNPTSPILPRMVSEGRVGKIGGVGFYRYPGGGGAVIDPLIEDLILEEAHFAKTKRNQMDDADIVDYILGQLRSAVETIDPSQAVSTLVARLKFPQRKLKAFDL